MDTFMLVVICTVTFSLITVESRSTNVENEGSPVEHIELRVLTKREAPDDIHKAGYPHVNGRTFRASEPLDPKHGSDKSEHQSIPQGFSAFETVNTLFQPEIEEGGYEESETGAERQLVDRESTANRGEETAELQGHDHREEDNDDTATGNVDSNENVNDQYAAVVDNDDGDGEDDDEEEEERPAYAAQYPYRHTTSDEYGRAEIYPTTVDEDGEDGSESEVIRRRVVVTGSDRDQRVTDTRYSGQSRHVSGDRRSSGSHGSGNTYPTDRQTASRYPQPSRTQPTHDGQGVASGSSNVYSQFHDRSVGYQSSRPERRGSYYGGTRYVDNNGHYVDAQGRHLDSTGQYYDASGRYQDATMTHRVNYPSGDPRRTQVGRYVPSSSGTRTPGSGVGEVDRSGDPRRTQGGRYVSSSSGTRTVGSGLGEVDRSGDPRRTQGGQYVSGGRYVTSGAGTRTSGSGVMEVDRSGDPRRTQGGQYVSGGRYVTSGAGTRTSGSNVGEVDPARSRPVNSYGGTQFYSGGSTYRTTYDPIVSQISSDPSCPETSTRVTINGLECYTAVAQLGRYVCYNYERVSTECCQSCLAVKRAEQVGCEYGDRSTQCRDMQATDCYNDRNRQICCERCEQLRSRMPEQQGTSCEYGDLTPRCENIRQMPYLCYLPENQRICCSTCPRLARSERSDCQWGDQSPEICEPFDASRRLKINCYLENVRQLCCATCPSLAARMPDQIPGCEYGDSPIQFNTGRGVFGCSEYIRQYGVDECDNPELSRECCYTCYRYRQHTRRG